MQTTENHRAGRRGRHPLPRAPRDPTGRQEGEPPCSDAFPKTESRPRRPARWEQSEPTSEGGQMDKEKKAEAIAAMADSLADFPGAS